MENKTLTISKNTLERYLTDKERSILKEGYALYKAINNPELGVLLLRRIDDVISIVKYIEIGPSNEQQSNYDCLTERINNLSIAIENIKNPAAQVSKKRYVTDKTRTPLIIRSLEYVDDTKFLEISLLLENVDINPLRGEIIEGNLRRMVGDSVDVIYLLEHGYTAIYDIESRISPKISKSTIKAVKDRCRKSLTGDTNPVLEKIYDDMVIHTISNSSPIETLNPALAKER